ncbi:hypothetical protein GMD78_01040 [Ornithinibacillus sp. L9]|uniref:Aminoglycoside phosphotransferase domain-containing protein n=1 Tax=Ornithinibacillus caprae TaxID=2678566 RepID=A0A6N8FG16_9BACI|nr:hypothetical protein [Ornithinibacillus caprae]MUK86987.1 hypothetical protein [Ornithinibacillus caprae]
MSNNKHRDDNNYDRLSSFLYWEGSLETKDINRIKDNVFLIKDNTGEGYIFKRHKNINNVKQQWDFFSQIKMKSIAPFVRYPNGRKIITDGNHNIWTLTPYIPGIKLNYRSQTDRKEAVLALKKFHDKASSIYVQNQVQKGLFYLRWYDRLKTFQKTEYFFVKYGYENLYKDIVKITEQYIQLVSRFPWKREQRYAEEQGLWVHGDVASHNFIRYNRIYLIDFDLLACTTQLYDYIQLGQRFLPYIRWDIDQLESYKMIDDRYIPIWLLSIAIPSDVLREWLHYLYQHRSGYAIKEYLEEMEKNWIKRQNFMKMTKKMLK